MATAQLDYVLQQFTFFVDGFGKAGTGETCELPKLKKLVEKFRGGGMRGTREVALGYDVMDFKGGLSAFDPQVLGKGGLDIDRSLAFSVRGYLTGDRGSTHTAVAQLRGEVKELDPGKWEPGKKAMLGFTTTVDAYRLVIDGTEVWDIDIENDVYTARGGVDFEAAVRNALGF